jgi:hypothetical protein
MATYTLVRDAERDAYFEEPSCRDSADDWFRRRTLEGLRPAMFIGLQLDDEQARRNS